jgi:hypothetical protein
VPRQDSIRQNLENNPVRLLHNVSQPTFFFSVSVRDSPQPLIPVLLNDLSLSECAYCSVGAFVGGDAKSDLWVPLDMTTFHSSEARAEVEATVIEHEPNGIDTWLPVPA